MDNVKYLTLVTLVCYVQGQRTEIPAGRPVPADLSEHAIEELLASGSIERADADKLAKRQEQLAGGETQAAFERERELLQVAREENERAAAAAAAAAGGSSAEAGGGGSTSTSTDGKDSGKGGSKAK